MNILKRIRDRSAARSRTNTGTTEGRAPDRSHKEGWEHLSEKELIERLPQLSQAQLTEVERVEREHDSRKAVLAKLRWLRQAEPMEGYDQMSTSEVKQGLAGADSETVRNVRDYERTFQGRRAVTDETARVLPDSPTGEREARAREEKEASVQEGIASRPS